LASYGSRLGCRRLGFDYETGTGIAENLDKAEETYRWGCFNGDKPSCQKQDAISSLKDAQSDYNAKNYTAAAPLFDKSCTAGERDACNYLGWLYENGNGVPEDDQKAATLFQKACDASLPDGCNYLAAQYDDGIGVDRSLAKAKQLYQKACGLGFQASCAALKKPKFQ
jgi:TPR repeat protein